MREKRNAVLIVLLFVFGIWAFWAWFYVGTDPVHKSISAVFFVLNAIALIWALKFEDKLPDRLAGLTGGIYYEQNGLCLMPVMRKQEDRAYLCVYFENRYENPCDAIVHLRPPPNSIQHRPDAYDIHFAFSCPGGAVGVLHQPVAVHPRLQGQVIDVKFASAVNYPHAKGDKLRSKNGLRCGTFEVDWGESFRTGSHELSGEIELIDPVTIHLALPREVSNRIRAGQEWRQEIIATE